MHVTTQRRHWPRPEGSPPTKRARNGKANGVEDGGDHGAQLVHDVLAKARATLAQDGATSGRGTREDPLQLREFAPEDFREGGAGAAFLARHGVAAARVAPVPTERVAQLADQLDGELRARGITRTGLAADGELRARILQSHEQLPLQLRTARIGGGHTCAELDPPLPLVEAGLLLDRVGQSRAAWHLRGQSAPVFDALFNVRAPTAPGDPEPLMADAMPFAFAVPGRPVRLVSALRPQPPRRSAVASVPPARFNALRPLRPHGLLHVVPGASVLYAGPSARNPATRDAVHAFLASLGGTEGQSEPPVARRLALALNPDCVYLWHPAMWAALDMHAAATSATAPFLGQFQRFRPLPTDAATRRERQWAFAVRARGTNPAHALAQAGLPRQPPARPPESGTWVPRGRWRAAAEAFANDDQRRTQRLANALFPPYADPAYTFPQQPTPLTACMVQRRPYSLIGGADLVDPFLPSACTHDVLEGLLSADARAAYEAWCATEAAFHLNLLRRRNAERAARETQTDALDPTRLVGAAGVLAHLYSTIHADHPTLTRAEFDRMTTGSLLSRAADRPPPSPTDPASAPARVEPPVRATSPDEEPGPATRIAVDLFALPRPPVSAEALVCALCRSEGAAVAQPEARYWIRWPAHAPHRRASAVACAPCVLAELAAGRGRGVVPWWRTTVAGDGL